MDIMRYYRCWDCEYEFTSRLQEAPDCPVCKSSKTGVDYHIGGGNYDQPIHSDALAVHPSQRAEHEKMFPNVRLDGQNRPVFNNFTDHESYMKKINVIKVPQKLHIKGERIA